MRIVDDEEEKYRFSYPFLYSLGDIPFILRKNLLKEGVSAK